MFSYPIAQNRLLEVGGYTNGRKLFSVDSLLQNPFCGFNPKPGKLQQRCSMLVNYYTEL
jgi:hypothetical protein